MPNFRSGNFKQKNKKFKGKKSSNRKKFKLGEVTPKTSKKITKNKIKV